MIDFPLIAAALSHPNLRRFIFKSPLYESPPGLPVSHSLQYIAVRTLNLSTVGKCFPQARFLDIASFDQSILPNLICPHLRILHLCVSQMKAVVVCSLFNFNAFPSLKEINLNGNIDRGTEMTLFEFGDTFLPLMHKLKKVTLHINIVAARIYADPTQNQFRKFIEIERQRREWKQLDVNVVRSFPRLWYELHGLLDKTTKK